MPVNLSAPAFPVNSVEAASDTPQEQPRNQTEVYAVHGADPEVLAYAMAKYSRSALSMKESLREINSQRAEQFLNTFYFQYGHRSIADLAHIAFAIERLSIFAAIVLVDEQCWDGQERSTRYQNFSKSGWYLPEFGAHHDAEGVYTGAIRALFEVYRSMGEQMLEHLKSRTPQPEGMKADAYTRTLRARAFDVARYLLPLATNTSLGQIVSARTLEGQISRLLSNEHAEIRELGMKLSDAASGPAWNVNSEQLAELQQQLSAPNDGAAREAYEYLRGEVKVAPTLVKYAAPSEYAIQTRRELEQAAAQIFDGAGIEPAPLVDLVQADEPLEVELAATLLYGVCHYSYRQVRQVVSELGEARRNEIIDLGLRHRGRYDELLREFSSGHGLRFDILMDIGGFRDMHRHRKCEQVIQRFTAAHGYELPEYLAEAGLDAQYTAAMDAAHSAYKRLQEGGHELNATYLLPLGTRCRALFKMDFAEALYIAELRSQPQGHFSYRRIAWEIYQAVARQHPALAKYFRVSDVREPVDLLKR